MIVAISLENLPEYLTATQVAAVLQVGADTVRARIRSGELTANRFGSRYRVSKDSLRSFIEASKVQP